TSTTTCSRQDHSSEYGQIGGGRAGVTYTADAQTHVSYQRRVRQRTGEAITSAAQQDPQQPDQ
ncbi:hypothetical protein Tco_0463741, partial [Tanacetum coccineum]